MKKWTEFEANSTEFLNEKYGSTSVKFVLEGASDSTAPDIRVFVNNNNLFNMDAKQMPAHCGQFVVLPNYEVSEYYFSHSNKTKNNEHSQAMIDYMNLNFSKFLPSTAGVKLDMGSSIFYSWVKSYYASKGVKFFIAGKKEKVIIVPVGKLEEYFNISAIYRIKNSGSKHPAIKTYPAISDALGSECQTIERRNKKAYAIGNNNLIGKIFFIGERKYLINEYFEIRECSNTKNPNIVFSLELIKDQDPKDLEEFIAFLN